MSEDRAPDVVTLLWVNDDGTITSETTNYTKVPITRESRVWANWDMSSLSRLAEGSVLIPSDVSV